MELFECSTSSSSTISTTSLLSPQEADEIKGKISPSDQACGTTRPTTVCSEVGAEDSCEADSWGKVLTTEPSVLMLDKSSVEQQQITSTAATVPSQRQQERAALRYQRLVGHLIESTLRELTAKRNGHDEYYLEGAIHHVLASYSQFSVTKKVSGKVMMPPLCSDSCQTFATVSAVLLSSLGFVVNVQECWNTSTVNYLLYISAWLHQLTQPLWGIEKSRPTVKDLNNCLGLQNVFPAKVQGDDFFFLFYNEGPRALDLIMSLCDVSEAHSRKRTRAESVDVDDGGNSAPRRSSESKQRQDPVCGYVIVSGDYTVSVFSVLHDIPPGKNLPFESAWNLYLCDSHGTLPWVNEKAAICCVSAGVPNPDYDVLTGGDEVGKLKQCVFPLAEGVRHFCNMLFSLLEHNRRSKWTQPSQVKDFASPSKPVEVSSRESIPYMTWTPIRRRLSQVRATAEITALIDDVWVPQVLSHPLVALEQQRFGGTHPGRCFWGLSTKHAAAAAPPCRSARDHDSGVTITSIKGNDVEVDVRRSAVLLSQDSPEKQKPCPAAGGKPREASAAAPAPPATPLVLKSKKSHSAASKKPPATRDGSSLPKPKAKKSTNSAGTVAVAPTPSPLTMSEERTGAAMADTQSQSALLNQRTLDDYLPANMVPNGKTPRGAKR